MTGVQSIANAQSRDGGVVFRAGQIYYLSFLQVALLTGPVGCSPIECFAREAGYKMTGWMPVPL